MCSPLDRSIILFATILFSSGAGLAGCVRAQPDREDTGSTEEALSTAECPDFQGDTSIRVPADQRLWFTLHAIGVQIYRCDATASGYTWAFQGPEADLFNDGDQQVGSHYAGPTWEHVDGSTVHAMMVPPAYTPPGSNAIPWLRLRADEHTGSGKMSNVTYLQRLNTTGGKAPTSGCDAAHVGDVARVDYTADYFFYRTGQGNTDNNPRCGD